MANELTQKQINKLVVEYKKYYDGDEEVTEEKSSQRPKRIHQGFHKL